MNCVAQRDRTSSINLRQLIAKMLLLSSLSGMAVACSTATPSDSSANSQASDNATDTYSQTDSQAIESQEIAKNTETKETAITENNDSSKDDERPDFSMLEANAVYENQDFSADLYAEFLETEEWCLSSGACGTVRYIFNDVLLVASMPEVGYETKIIPHHSVSRTEALRYARILDSSSVVDFSEGLVSKAHGPQYSHTENRQESFFEADTSEEGAAYQQASAHMVQLIIQPSGDVSDISLIIAVF